MVVKPLWRGPDNIDGFFMDGKCIPTMMGYCSNIKGALRFRRDDNKVDFMHVQPCYYLKFSKLTRHSA